VSACGMDISEHRGPTRVLLLEDEPLVAQFVVRGLELDGHQVVVAEDGEVGAFLAGTEPFDVFVLDLTSPESSALEVLGRIGEAGGGTPVVVLSELDDPDARPAYEGAGAAACLAKPLVVDELRAAVNAQLARQRSLSQSSVTEALEGPSVAPGESPATT
jgi:DNA-binding response OmpR family regulator